MLFFEAMVCSLSVQCAGPLPPPLSAAVCREAMVSNNTIDKTLIIAVGRKFNDNFFFVIFPSLFIRVNVVVSFQVISLSTLKRSSSSSTASARHVSNWPAIWL